MTDEPRNTMGGVVAEIVAEAASRRGALEPGLEARLDALFGQLTPGGADAGALSSAIDTADHHASFVVDVPVGSRRPGARLAKRLVRRVIGWYVRWFVDQFERFARSVVAALRIVADEAVSENRPEAWRAALAAARPSVEPGVPWWTEPVAQRLVGAPGPVVHGECGSGAFLASLAGSGVDAYGVDSSADAVASAAASGSLVRTGGLAEHLALVADQSLGGVVAEGAVQWMTPAECAELARLVASRLAPGGTAVVVSSTPVAWARAAGTVMVDLAGGHPLHAETWKHLLTVSGLSDASVLSGPPGLDGVAEQYAVVAAAPA